MLELMLEKYWTEVKIKRIQTKPKGIAQEIIIHITRATCILIGEFILLCRSNIRYTSNIVEYKPKKHYWSYTAIALVYEKKLSKTPKAPKAKLK